MRFFGLVLFSLSLLSAEAFSAAEVSPVRGYEKFAVFPIAFSDQRGLKVDSQTSDSLQEAWWEVREELADTGRF
jgi:hypothetical protein